MTALVSERALEDPDRPAVEDGERRFTYGELHAAASGIARELLTAGVGPQELVAVCLPRSWEAVACFLGVLYAGAAYVPINPAHPPMRQRSLVERAGVRVALTDGTQGQGLPPGLVRLDARHLAGHRAATQLDYPPGGDRLAFVLFTSGSTGRPKGVEITHGNLTNLLCSGSIVAPRIDDAVLHVVPLDFDISAHEIWGALVSGARLVIAPDGRPDPVTVGRLIASRGVSFVFVSAGVLHELVRAALPDLAGVRLIMSGGEVLSPVAVRALKEAHPKVRMINVYGPTETTIVATAFEVGELDGNPIPIGHAAAWLRTSHTRRRPADRCLPARPASFGSAAREWLGATCVTPNAPLRCSIPTHAPPIRCTEQATRSASARTDRCCSWAAWTAR